jgi:hypothetical protein
MVAVTGALAMDNAEDGDDLDYLVVTEPGRLWLCRALIILLVRRAKGRASLCPNYFITLDGLSLEDHSLFSAHELAQMVPVYGLDTYWAMRRLNPWAEELLPNAAGAPVRFVRDYGLLADSRGFGLGFKRAGETFLRTPAGAWLKGWEQRRKVAHFGGLAVDHPEARFDAETCKGHFSNHRRQVELAYARRMARYG